MKEQYEISFVDCEIETMTIKAHGIETALFIVDNIISGLYGRTLKGERIDVTLEKAQLYYGNGHLCMASVEKA